MTKALGARASAGWSRRLGATATLLVALMLAGANRAAIAVTLPDLPAMRAALGVAPDRIRVVEPHLSTRDHPVYVEYVGGPAEKVLDQWLGSAWRDGDTNTSAPFRSIADRFCATDGPAASRCRLPPRFETAAAS